MEAPTQLYPLVLDPALVRSFEANGRTYHVESHCALSVTRDRFLERFTLWAAFSRSGDSFRKELRKAYDSLNAGRMADAVVHIDNLLRGSIEAETKNHPVLYICTLFINSSDEDRAEFSMELAEEKIRDWSRIGREFFFTLATSFLQSIGDDLNKATQTFSAIPLVDLSFKS